MRWMTPALYDGGQISVRPVYMPIIGSIERGIYHLVSWNLS